MATVAERVYKLTVQSQQATRELQKFNNGVKGIDAQLQKAGDQMKKFARLAAGAFSVNAIVGFGRETLQMAEQIDLASKKIGVTAENFQVFSEAAQRVGLSSQAAETALQRFSRRAAEAGNGTGVLYKEFQNLGIATKDANGNMRDVTDILGDYADAVAGTSSASERLRLSVAAFDTEGAGLVNTLSKGSKGFQDLNKEMREANQIMSSESIQRASEISQKWDEVTRGISLKMKSVGLEAVEFWDKVFGITTGAKAAQADAAVSQAIDNLRGLQEAMAGDRVQGSETLIRRYAEAIQQSYLQVQALREERDALRGITTEAPIVANAINEITNANINGIAPVSQFDQEMTALAESMRKVDLAAANLTSSSIANGSFDFGFADTDFSGIDSELASITETMRNQQAIAEQLGTSWRDYLTAGAEDVTTSVSEMAEELKTAIDGFGRDFTNNLVDGLAQGKLAFKDFAKDILATIAKIVLNKQFEALFSMISGGLSSGIAGLFSGGGGGGIGTTRAAIPTPKTYNVGVPKPVDYGHSPKRSKASGVNINVINKSDAKVEAKTKEGPNGMEVEFMIEQAVSRQMGSGAYDKVLNARYGVNRRGY